MGQWQIHILPRSQRLLLDELKDTPKEFVLYGGTAIALRLGHRESVDFDFFTPNTFNPDKLYHTLPYLSGSEVFQSESNTLSVIIDKFERTVKLSFFGGLAHLRQVANPEIMDPFNIRVASLLDLFGMKCATIYNRVEKKDYLDVHEIITQTRFRLEDGLRAALSIYGDRQYSPVFTKKALTFFEDGDLPTLPDEVKTNLIYAVKNTPDTALYPFDQLSPLGYEN